MMVCASTTDRHRPSVSLYIVRVVVLGVVNDVLLRCVPMVMATISTIDGYGFSFNYVGRGEHH